MQSMQQQSTDVEHDKPQDTKDFEELKLDMELKKLVNFELERAGSKQLTGIDRHRYLKHKMTSIGLPILHEKGKGNIPAKILEGMRRKSMKRTHQDINATQFEH